METVTELMRIDAGDTSWLLVCTALVFVMVPGLALFYGALVRAKSTLNMMLMTFVAAGLTAVVWTGYAWSVAFGHGGRLWGGMSQAGLSGVVTQGTTNGVTYPVPLIAFVMFQLMFAIITVALISGAVADRVRFSAWCAFVVAWVSLVYAPVAHWAFDFGGADCAGAGWLAQRGLLDFAGGTVVEINSGAAGLALALVVGRRVGWPQQPMKPHSMPLALVGAGLLWFGWFGFNAGSALQANVLAATALANTMLAGAAGLLAWLVVERVRDSHPTTLGGASGAIAGLVGITPSCGFVEPWAALVIGALAGTVCAFAVRWKYRWRIDESLDVFGVHLVAGVIGCLSLGFLATTTVNASGRNGLLYGGGTGVLGTQLLAVVVVLGYSFVITLVLAKVIDGVMGLRIDTEAEVTGIDLDQHLESAYDLSSANSGVLGQHSAAHRSEVN